MLTVLTLLKLKPSPDGHLHGERPFWREFGEQYLRAWVNGVRKHVSQPYTIRVMTDSPQLVTPLGVETVGLDTAVDAPGWWAKMNAFREDVSNGTCLYMDLDTTLVGDLSELCALDPDPLIMLDDRHVPGLPNGSVMMFHAERLRSLWTTYKLIPRELESAFVVKDGDYSKAFDQAYVAERVTRNCGDVPFFQELLPLGYCLNAFSELPRTDDWRTARLIYGCGGSKEGKMHSASHRVFAENWASV